MEYDKKLDLDDIKEGHKICSLKDERHKSIKEDMELKKYAEGEEDE